MALRVSIQALMMRPMKANTVSTIIRPMSTTTTPMLAGRINDKVAPCGNDSAIVTQVKKSDINGKMAFCRCWLSSKFPECDGTHNKHNKETGDNVGPVVVTAGQ